MVDENIKTNGRMSDTSRSRTGGLFAEFARFIEWRFPRILSYSLVFPWISHWLKSYTKILPGGCFVIVLS